MILRHLSFDRELEGRWSPRNVEVGAVKPTKKDFSIYPEPNLPRICVAPTELGCFQAIYPNISHYFEDLKWPHIDIYEYVADLKPSTKIMTPEELTEKRYVWDAHITQEHLILSDVNMRLARRIRVTLNPKDEGVKTHAFDDPSEAIEYIHPSYIDVKTIEVFES